MLSLGVWLSRLLMLGVLCGRPGKEIRLPFNVGTAVLSREAPCGDRGAKERGLELGSPTPSLAHVLSLAKLMSPLSWGPGGNMAPHKLPAAKGEEGRDDCGNQRGAGTAHGHTH